MIMCEHTHPREQTQQVLNRISRAAGHLAAVGRMIEEGRDCSDVLIQLAAVRSAVNNVGKLIINDHLSRCIAAAVEQGDRTSLERFTAALDTFLK